MSLFSAISPEETAGDDQRNVSDAQRERGKHDSSKQASSADASPFTALFAAFARMDMRVFVPMCALDCDDSHMREGKGLDRFTDTHASQRESSRRSV